MSRTTITKETVKAFIRSKGGIPHYSGNQRTMFIEGKDAPNIELSVLKTFKNLAYRTQSIDPKQANMYSVLMSTYGTVSVLKQASTAYVDCIRSGNYLEIFTGTERECRLEVENSISK